MNTCKTLKPIIEAMEDDADFLAEYAEQVADTAKGFSGAGFDAFQNMVDRFQRIEGRLRGAIEEMRSDAVCVCEIPGEQEFTPGVN